MKNKLNKQDRQDLQNKYHKYIIDMDSIQLKDWTKDTPFEDLFEKVMYQDFDSYIPEDRLLKKLKMMILQSIEFERIPDEDLIEVVKQTEELMRKEYKICTE